MRRPSTGLRSVGHPSFREASATSGMWANLMVASKSMNATGIPVSTRPDQRAVDGLRGRTAVSSVASNVVSWFGVLERTHAETTNEAPRDRHGSAPAPKYRDCSGNRSEALEGARHLRWEGER